MDLKEKYKEEARYDFIDNIEAKLTHRRPGETLFAMFYRIEKALFEHDYAYTVDKIVIHYDFRKIGREIFTHFLNAIDPD